TWLAPVQVKILPISDKFNDYAQSVRKKLNESGIRVELDDRSEKIGYKIREARNERVPYIVIIGEKEQTEKNISLRSRKNGDEGAVDINKFIETVEEEVRNMDI
ncbi:MAG: His/Gly/Thr/Pro-type tRNA ligase C-terminal domain-containing protein, partial [Clostridium sp.]